jgi:hypothetical protein
MPACVRAHAGVNHAAAPDACGCRFLSQNALASSVLTHNATTRRGFCACPLRRGRTFDALCNCLWSCGVRDECVSHRRPCAPPPPKTCLSARRPVAPAPALRRVTACRARRRIQHGGGAAGGQLATASAEDARGPAWATQSRRLLRWAPRLRMTLPARRLARRHRRRARVRRAQCVWVNLARLRASRCSLSHRSRRRAWWLAGAANTEHDGRGSAARA